MISGTASTIVAENLSAARRLISLVILGSTLVIGGPALRAAGVPAEIGNVTANPLSSVPQLEPESLSGLLALDPEEFAFVDIARMNLLCATGLPGAEGLDVPAVLRRLDQWADRVKRETERHLYRVTHPRFAKYYGGSEARLRCEFLVLVLQEDFGVRYNSMRASQPSWRDARDLFFHGMISDGERGTCGSMPVLYVAIGRRLGYPLYLVLAKQHVFCRWEDEQECLNFDGSTERGVGFEADDFYRVWPKWITDEELASGTYLRSLSPVEELGFFLYTRGTCLAANGRLAQGQATLRHALQFVPQAPFVRDRLATTETLLQRLRADAARRRLMRSVQETILPPINGGRVPNTGPTEGLGGGLLPRLDPRTRRPRQPGLQPWNGLLPPEQRPGGEQYGTQPRE